MPIENTIELPTIRPEEQIVFYIKVRNVYNIPVRFSLKGRFKEPKGNDKKLTRKKREEALEENLVLWHEWLRFKCYYRYDSDNLRVYNDLCPLTYSNIKNTSSLLEWHYNRSTPVPGHKRKIGEETPVFYRSKPIYDNSGINNYYFNSENNFHRYDKNKNRNNNLNNSKTNNNHENFDDDDNDNDNIDKNSKNKNKKTKINRKEKENKTSKLKKRSDSKFDDNDDGENTDQISRGRGRGRNGYSDRNSDSDDENNNNEKEKEEFDEEKERNRIMNKNRRNNRDRERRNNLVIGGVEAVIHSDRAYLTAFFDHEGEPKFIIHPFTENFGVS